MFKYRRLVKSAAGVFPPIPPQNLGILNIRGFDVEQFLVASSLDKNHFSYKSYRPDRVTKQRRLSQIFRRKKIVILVDERSVRFA